MFNTMCRLQFDVWHATADPTSSGSNFSAYKLATQDDRELTLIDASDRKLAGNEWRGFVVVVGQRWRMLHRSERYATYKFN